MKHGYKSSSKLIKRMKEMQFFDKNNLSKINGLKLTAFLRHQGLLNSNFAGIKVKFKPSPCNFSPSITKSGVNIVTILYSMEFIPLIFKLLNEKHIEFLEYCQNKSLYSQDMIDLKDKINSKKAFIKSRDSKKAKKRTVAVKVKKTPTKYEPSGWLPESSIF